MNMCCKKGATMLQPTACVAQIMASSCIVLLFRWGLYTEILRVVDARPSMIRMVFVYLYTGTLVKFLKKYCWLTNIKWHGDRRPTAWTAHDQLVECWQVDYTQLLFSAWSGHWACLARVQGSGGMPPEITMLNFPSKIYSGWNPDSIVHINTVYKWSTERCGLQCSDV